MRAVRPTRVSLLVSETVSGQISASGHRIGYQPRFHLCYPLGNHVRMDNSVNDAQTPASDILTNIADHGELILQAMSPGMGPSLDVVVWASHWVAFGTWIVKDLLGPERVAQFGSSPEYGDRTSEVHPLPEGIAESLISYWHSVAWRIDRLREWGQSL